MVKLTLKKLLLFVVSSSVATWLMMHAYITSKKTNFREYSSLHKEAVHYENTYNNIINKELLEKPVTSSEFDNVKRVFVTGKLVKGEEIKSSKKVKKIQSKVSSKLNNLNAVNSKRNKVKSKVKILKKDELQIIKVVKKDTEVQKDQPNIRYCPKTPPNLKGPLKVDAKYVPTIEQAINNAGSNVQLGCYKPDWCKPLQRVAVVIPYKNREQHLITLSYHIHPILQRQLLHYCIFVAEQYDNGVFNKAMIMNAAYNEVLKIEDPIFDCIVYHDVDMLLEDDRNIYTCGGLPRHLSPAIDKFNYTLGYGTEFGGVTALSMKHYKDVDGYSNNFWGWGGEDNDMEERIKKRGLKIDRGNPEYGRFKMIPHIYPWWFSPQNGIGSWLQWRKHKAERNPVKSGLSTLKYILKYTDQQPLWTKFTFDIRNIVVEKVSVHFTGTKDSDITVNSRAAYTESVSYKEDCYYQRYTGKNINKTLGLIEKTTYGRMYDFDEAVKLCNQMNGYCHAIVEEFKNQFSLRSNAYIKNNTMTYIRGLVEQTIVTETHKTHSVNVKVCPGDPQYTSILKKPVVLSGNERMGTSPSYSVDFSIRLYNAQVDSILTFVCEIATVHKTVQNYKIEAKLQDLATHSSLGHKQIFKKQLVALGDSKAVNGYMDNKEIPFEEAIKESSVLLKIKTNRIGFIRLPGFYVAKCNVIDELGTSVLTWEFLFEVQAATEEIAKKFQELEFKKYALYKAEMNAGVGFKKQIK